MHEASKEYLSLIRDTIAYVAPRAPQTPKKVVKKTIVPPKPKPITLPPAPKPSFELKLPEVPKEVLSSRFAALFGSSYVAEVPSDKRARRIKEGWREKKEIPDFPILCVSHKAFLENVARAIDLTFGPSRVVNAKHYEENKSWDLFLEAKNLKVILAQDSFVWNSPQLMAQYGKTPERFVLLPDLDLYMKDPYLKRSLWSVICQSLKSS